MGSVRRRDEALAFIIAYIVRTGASPTVQEIADELGVSKPRIRELLTQLEVDNVIQRVPGTQRGIRVRDVYDARQTLVEACRKLGWSVEGDLATTFPYGKLSRLPPIRYLPPDDQEQAA